jgi:heterodisulfide reductase subunit B
LKIGYFPGCTLKTSGKGFERSALESAAVLGIELQELPRWNCCGTVHTLATDDLMHELAPTRILLRAQEHGHDKLVTLCSMCYHTLKSANLSITADPEKLQKLNDFMYEEEQDYLGGVEVVHYLTLLRDQIGFERLSNLVKVPLAGLKVAPYYGCLLLRPSEVGIDLAEMPRIMEDFLGALGAEAVRFPFAVECCGSYQTVGQERLVALRAKEIVESARRHQAEVIALSCPLCEFNLNDRQQEAAEEWPGFRGMPTVYFTELLALALGLGEESCGFALHYRDPRPVLRAKGILQEVEVPA